MVIAAGLHAIADTANLVLLAILLAMTITPIPDYLGKHGMQRGHAVLLTVFGVLVVGVLLMSVLAASLAGISEKLPTYQAALTGLVDQVGDKLATRGINLDKSLRPDTERITAMVGNLVKGALGAMGYGFLLLILLILMLIEMPFRRKGDQPADSLNERLDDVAISVRRFVGLTGMIGAVQAALNLIAMLLLGTDFPVVWAVLFFLLNFVPFGFLVGLIPPLLVTLLESGPTQAGILLGVLFVLNLIADNVVKPKIMGEGLGLSPAIIVVSLMVWAYILGAMGAILAVPLTIAISRMLPHFMQEETA
jgi:predicted PurR-regulated permease PerM